MYALTWIIVAHLATRTNKVAVPFAFRSAPACAAVAADVKKKYPAAGIACLELRIVTPEPPHGRTRAR